MQRSARHASPVSPITALTFAFTALAATSCIDSPGDPAASSSSAARADAEVGPDVSEQSALGTSPLELQAISPDFDRAYAPFECSADPVNDESPSSIDLVGDGLHPAAYFAHDAQYLYFRYRVDGEPSGPGGFDQSAWVALMQVPYGNEFCYQYALALDGKKNPDDFGNTGDNIEIWENDVATASDIGFDPIFNDPAETRVYAQNHTYTGPGAVNTAPLARFEPALDGSQFGGDDDYFVDFAFPISVLIAEGLITSAADLDNGNSLFFVATSADANNYNKDTLGCPFQPSATLAIAKSVTPSTVPADTSTHVTYTITVTNVSDITANGVEISDTQFPVWLTDISVTATGNDGLTVVSSDPLRVTDTELAPGDTITIIIDAEAHPAPGTPTFTNIASAYATNAAEVDADAALSVGSGLCAQTDCDDDNPCSDDGCDPESGDCQHTANADPCDDGDACTTGDTCSGSACAGGAPPDCADTNPCTSDGCDPASGCTHSDNSDSCDDGDACKTGDTCSGGTCMGGAPPDCADTNPCTNDSCDPASGCTHSDNTDACNDGNACTLNDTCSGGTCMGGAPPDCADTNPCTNDGCDPASGCTHSDNTDACNDGNACTLNDTCSGGTCAGGAPPSCDDANPCTTDACDPATGCTHSDNSDSCDDGNACTLNDTCSGGTCTGGAPPDCADTNPCTNDACDPASGCTHSDNANACNDGNACTINDTCSVGTCAGGAPPSCDDANPCTTDACDPASGCTHSNNANACNDGNACTINDTCSVGTCAGGAPPSCDDANPCTNDSCDPATGCTHSNNANACNDGNACTVNDTCSGGTCAGGAPPSCDDANPCTTDACDPATGCAHSNNANACDDGDACTSGDTCSGGVCTGLGAGTVSTIASNFNGTAIKAGSTIWFSAVFKATGLGAKPVTLSFTDARIQFSANNASYDLAVPDATVTFDPALAQATTTFASGTWQTRLPPGGAGNTFLSGFAFPVVAGLPGGINPVSWTGKFTSDTPGVSIKWQWAAAVYTSFSSDYNALGVKPVDDNQLSAYANSDHAGTPEAFKSYVTGGARGGGGSNYTGSMSSTASVTPLVCE